ncbi:MAG TPA: GC-type dockerin domain-anchored protein, partial [Phycisphaerales bacterium]|nr:GC-type dockerin domain-anchored protein [Phycisphaerales bacterium]
MSLHSLSLIGLISCGLATTAISSPIDLDADGVPETIALGGSGSLEIRAGVSGGVLRTLPPPLPNAGFGSTWLVTPNVTGDATPELLVTSPLYPDAAGGVVGSVNLFDPQTATLLWTVTGTASHPLTTSILTIGDQDFDGLSEFLVQANGAEARVLVISSADGAVLATRDGSIGDISQLLASGVSVYSPADRDGNGLVDSADFKDFVDAYEAQGQSADITRDGVVDSADLARFVNGFAEGSITIDAVATGLASSSSGSGGSGGVTLNPPSNSIPGEQPDGGECGCPEAAPNPAECLPAEMTIVCPTIRDWPVNGGYIDVPWSVTLPPNATGLGVSCVSQCAGTNPQPQPSAIVVPGINRVTGTSSIFVQPNQRFVRICYSYQMQGSTEVCTVCASCMPECDLFELSLDIEIESPSFLIPGGTHHFNVVPENAVCDEWIWIVLEGAEWIAEPMFVPQSAPIPGLQPGQLVYIGGNSLEVEIAVADVPSGTAPVVRVAAMCVQTNSCSAAWDGAEGSSFVCDDFDDDLLADCQELAMADGGNCPNHLAPDSDDDGYDDGVEVLHGSNPCHDTSTPVGSRDSDMDGASDFEEEFFRHTNPDRFDQDQDGLQDYAEFLLGTDPRNPMSSGGVRDGALPIAVAADQDADGLIDQYEMERGWNAGNADQDEDGIRDGLEVRRRMNPNRPDQGPAAAGIQVDTDGDGLSDSVERQLGTDSQRRDSDGDGVSDGNEARMGLDPTSARTHCRDCGPTDGEADWDNDGITNANEDELGLDPANADSDGDGKCDSQDMDDPQEQSCTPPDPCWTPNSQNGQSADCSGGACFVLNIGSCTNNGGSVVVNGERYPLPTCGSGELLLVPVQPGTDFSIAFSCGNWATHGSPIFGAACRRADGTFDQSSFKADPNHGSFAYQKDFYNDQSQCQGASTSVGGFDGAQHGYIPYPTPSLPQPGQNCASECALLGPPTINLWVDSNNDSQLAIKGVNDLDEQVEDDPTHPGKILFANTRDSDGDRIPDFADGFDADDHGFGSFGALANPHHELDNQSPGTEFVPLTISLGGSIPEGTRIKFSYSASPPSAVQPAFIPVEDCTNPTFPVESAGLLRLWTKVPAPRPTNAPRRGNIFQPPDTDGLVIPAVASNGPRLDPCAPLRRSNPPRRSKLDLGSGGSFVDSEVEYPVELLTGGSISKSITLLVEAVRASTTIQEGSIHAQLILPSGSPCVANSSDLQDTVRCTAVDRQYRPINPATGELDSPVREVPTSHPTPVITLEPTSGFVVLPPVVSTTNPSQLEANIVIQGTVRDAASNLIPGDAGKIRWLAVVVNGELLRSETGIPLPG